MKGKSWSGFSSFFSLPVALGASPSSHHKRTGMLAKRCRIIFSKVVPLPCRGIDHLPVNNSVRAASSHVVRSPLPDRDVPIVPYHEYIWSRCDKWINSEALVCGETGKTVSFAELKEQSEKFRSVVQSRLGLSPGDVLAVALPNCLEYPAIVLGCLEAGVIVSTINPVYTSSEIAHQLHNSGAKAIVTSHEKLSAVQEAVDKSGLKGFQILLTGPSSSIQDSSTLSYERLLQDSGQYSMLGATTGQPEDTVYIPYSSGTTGVPKGVCLTNRNLVSNLMIFETSTHFDETTSKHQAVMPLVLPMFHVYAFALMMNSIQSGAKMIVLPKLEEKTLIRALRDYKASVLYAVPPLIQYMIVNKSIGAAEMASLKTVLSGAAPLAESDVRRLVQKSGRTLRIRNLYGATETSPLVVDACPSVGKIGSVGRPGLNTQIKIIEAGGSGEALGPGVSGEICIRGPQIMKGYLNNKKATDEAIDSEGWFRSGDIGHYDSDECFFVTDRVKELIKVKGFQVAPAEIEAVLRSHPDVLEAGVVGKKDSRNGETPVAFVVVKENTRWSEDSLKNFLSHHLAPFKIPSKFVKLANVPKSESGKILRRELRALVSQQ